MMKSARLLGAAVLAFASVAAHADDTYTFQDLTSSEYFAYANANLGTSLVLRGTLVNDSVPTSLIMVAPLGIGGVLDVPCVKYIDEMLTKPNAYTLSVVLRTSMSGGVTYIRLVGCNLTRVP